MASTTEIVYNNDKIPTILIVDDVVNFVSGYCTIRRDLTPYIKKYGITGVIVQGLGINYTFTSSIVDGSMSNFAIYVHCMEVPNLTMNNVHLRLTYIFP